jgi:hypothetical protein
MTTANQETTIRCSCGKVEIKASGAPMTSVVCYCDSCQEGSRQIEELPNAGRVRDRDGGTAYVLYRKDRVQYSNGVELLKDYKIEEKSTTNRVVASCCNSPMVMRFDDAKHWVPIYRARFKTDILPLQWRICTRYKSDDARIPNDIPSSEMYPFGLMMKLLTSKIAMLLGL